MDPAFNDAWAWHASGGTLEALAWSRLNGCTRIPPALHPTISPHPRLRIWDAASSFSDNFEPITLTVFESCGGEGAERAVVRKATWNKIRDWQRWDETVEKSGDILLFEPTITVQDAELSMAQYTELLKEATTFQVPIVWLPDDVRISSDVGPVGFEFFSQDEPEAVLRLQWSDGKPKCWEPIVEWVSRMRHFLEASLIGS